MKTAIRDLPTLVQRLGLPPDFNAGPVALNDFPVFVPEPYLSRIQPGNPSDPLLLQVLPLPSEDHAVPGFINDPLKENESVLSPGLLQKYRSRVLFVVTGACAIHCRYCFRRHFPYQDSPNSIGHWEPAFEAIENDPSIQEVLLSGGDPLTLVDSRLEQLVHRLGEIPHLKRLRVHSRLPIVIPSRLTDRLLEIFSTSRLQTVMVVHANHANEIDADVGSQLQRASEAGIQLLNQSVLLKDINDSSQALVDLSERLLDCGALPYYLHQLDPVQGAAHFQVPIEKGLQLIEEIRKSLPGYGVPRYVQELAGQPNKTVLA